MRHNFIIILAFITQISFSQDQNIDKSYLLEIEAWQLFFDDKKIEAKEKFVKAIALDSTNYLAKIGLLSSKMEAELDETDFNLIQRLLNKGNYRDIMFRLMMSNQVDKELHDSLKVMRNKYDESYIRFKAHLTDSEFEVFNDNGDVIQTGSYKNRKPYGTWKKFGYDNRLHHSFSFSQETDSVTINYFKPDGVVSRKVFTTGMPFTNESTKLKEVIYWQETPGKNKEYLFVSKDGFTIFDRNEEIILDETTPNTIIQLVYNPATKTNEAFIWKNGKKVPYEYCPHDGTVVTYIENGKRRSYRWEDCKKVLINN